MLGQRRGRWPNIVPALGQCLVLAGINTERFYILYRYTQYCKISKNVLYNDLDTITGHLSSLIAMWNRVLEINLRYSEAVATMSSRDF